MNNYEDESVDIHQVENTSQKQSDAQSKKYRLSLLYLLKDLLLLVLKSGIIGALILNVLMYLIFKEPFKPIGCLAYIICGAVLGIIIGYVIKSLIGNDSGDSFANATGVTIYNMYAGVHNLHVLSGSTIGSGASILGLVLTVITWAFIVLYSLLLMPVSIVYLCIMSVIEVITHGIPKTLGNILDKLVMIGAGIGSIALIIYAIAQIG